MATLPRELEPDTALIDYAVAAEHPDVRERTIQLGFKRALDLIGGLGLAIVLSVPALIIAVLIKLDSRGPALLRQVRVGQYGHTFVVYKFRTMCEDADRMLDGLRSLNEQQGPLFKMRDDPRMTRVGKWLRKLSIDEVPQLINVIKGDMSLVGPRPPLPHEVREYTPRQLGRLAAKPGMTGLWQVNGRSRLTFEQMVDLDLRYIHEWSLLSDVMILVKTPLAVVSTRGAY